MGLCCAVLVTYARVNRLYGEKLFPKSTETGRPRRRSAFDVAFSILSGFDTLLPVIAFLAWEGGMPPRDLLLTQQHVAAWLAA